MATSQPTAKREEILKKVGGELPKAGDQGPTKTLLDTQEFDEIRLLSNYMRGLEQTLPFVDWPKS